MQHESIDVVAVLAAFIVLIICIDPIRNFPIQDDWDYSKTVWTLLRTGAFQRSEIAQATQWFPTIWGALFASVLGYSFVALRVSTLVLAAASLILFYALLAELGFDRPHRLMATLSLLVAPTFVFLAFSFMTDIPFLFGLIGALYFYVRAVRRAELRWAMVGSVFATLAFLTRQLGALIPLAFVLFTLAHPVNLAARHAGGLRAILHIVTRWALAGTIIPLISIGAYLVWAEFFDGANWADRMRTVGETVGFWLQPDFIGILRRRYVIATATIGIYLVPLWFAAVGLAHNLRQAWLHTTRRQQWLMLIVAGAFVFTLLQLAMQVDWFPYLTDILTRRGLRPYLAYVAYDTGAHRPYILPLAAAIVLTSIAGAFGLCLSFYIIRLISRRTSAELALVYGTTLLMAIASLTFFSFYERYLLPLLPGAIILLLDVTRRTRMAWRVGLMGLLIVAVFSITFMQDYLAWNQVKWDAARVLLVSGVPIEKIDGGYEWDGWYLYDESMTYIRAHDTPMTIAPWLTILDPEYIFAFELPPDYRIIQALKFSTPLRVNGSDQIFLLQREK